MQYVSDQAIEEILSSFLMSRGQYRRIKNLSRKEFQRYQVNLYREGFEDGAEAIQKYLEQKADISPEDDTEEVSIGWEDVLAVIGEVKGIGPKLLSAIDGKLKEVY